MARVRQQRSSEIWHVLLWEWLAWDRSRETSFQNRSHGALRDVFLDSRSFHLQCGLGSVHSESRMDRQMSRMQIPWNDRWGLA